MLILQKALLAFAMAPGEFCHPMSMLRIGEQFVSVFQAVAVPLIAVIKNKVLRFSVVDFPLNLRDVGAGQGILGFVHEIRLIIQAGL